MRTLASLLALALVAGNAIADQVPPLDPSVAAEIQRQAESSCLAEVGARLAGRGKPALPALARWFSELTDSSDYCACAARGIASNITVELLKPGAESELAALAKQAGVQCVVPKLKATFSSACRGMMLEAANLPEPTEAAISLSSEFCTCVQRDIDLLSPETFEDFMAATAQDYAAFKRSPGSPLSGGMSLVATMNRCGVDDIGRRIRSK